MIVLAGCDSSTGDGATPTSAATSIAADVPAGFAPCTDVPQSALDSEKLRQRIDDDSNASGGIKWRGCMWAKPDGYAVSIRTTNITIGMVKAKGFPDTTEYIIGGRRAVTSRQLQDHPERRCTLDVEMKGGSLEFALSNEPDNKATGHLDSCDLVRQLAEKVVPAIPANA
ncbi:DUF3558 domain-containing protein [Nocardia arizonensis]|uniref:DUF3558 domain-containing protein n=1 Tax=Nocardia arizonensis TaxID=1141647 RepID=UPI001EF544ED|nr:DUF3558 domain-containing protein [Nocardia arizonensis]